MWYIYKHFCTHSSFSQLHRCPRSSWRNTFSTGSRHDPITRPIIPVTSATRLYFSVSTPKNTNYRFETLTVHFFSYTWFRSGYVSQNGKKSLKVAGKWLVEIYVCHVTHFPSTNCSIGSFLSLCVCFTCCSPDIRGACFTHQRTAHFTLNAPFTRCYT